MTTPLTEDELARPLTAEEASFERDLLVKLLHERHHDQDCERTADAILRRGFRFGPSPTHSEASKGA